MSSKIDPFMYIPKKNDQTTKEHLPLKETSDFPFFFGSQRFIGHVFSPGANSLELATELSRLRLPH